MVTILVPYLDQRTRRRFAAANRDWLHGHGIRLVAADADLTDADRELFDELLPLPSYEQVGEAAVALEARAARGGIDAVLAQSEYGLLPAALLRERLQCPGITARAAFACTNKWASRRALAAAGVPVPRHALLRNAAGVRRFAGEVGYPLALKGVASTMARNVVKVSAPHEVEGAVARLKAGLAASPDLKRLEEFARRAGLEMGCDGREEFLAESWVYGAALETDGLVRGKRPETFGVLEQIWTEPPLLYIQGYLMPVDPAVADAEAVRKVSDAAAAASGLEDAGFAIEFRVRGQRDVWVIEVNGRLGEDDGFGRLFEAAAGIDPLRECVAHLAGVRGARTRERGGGGQATERRGEGAGERAGGASESSRAGAEAEGASGGGWAVAYANLYREGTVRRVAGPAELGVLEQETGCVEVRATVAAETRMHAPPHPDVFPHVAYALAEDGLGSRAAYAKARAAAGRVRVEVE